VLTAFVRQTGMLVMSRRVTERATLCRECATDAYRRCQAWNLALGWWGHFSFFMTFGALRRNAHEMRRVRAMPAPMERAADVVTPRTTPSAGAPLVQRPLTLVLVAFLLVVLALALT
jgi:hypothetical protein